MNDNDVTDIEARLAKALRADLPPARDPLFRIAVLERRERWQLRRRIAATIVVGAFVTIMASLVLTVLVDANTEAINAWLTEDFERVAVVLTIAATACFTLSVVWLTATDSVRGVLRVWRRWLWV
jgi:hypothetical protein